MSAGLLREAAAKMRERAEAATPGPWRALSETSGAMSWDVEVVAGDDRLCTFDPSDYPDGIQDVAPEDDAEHIASWHPDVALAVADWLDLAARRAEVAEGLGDGVWMQIDRAAVTVARAYLGTT